jgi:hypothetical protein
VPGVSTGADAQAIYVAHVRVPAAGNYQLVARPLGGNAHIAALGDLVVRPRAAPHLDRRCARRARAVRRHLRDAQVLREPHLRAVVDVVDRVRKQYARTPVRFIHVEIYTDNNPSKGRNRWVREWHLPGEPWTFLVGRDGRIKAKFEGSVSVRELGEAIRRLLL